MELILNTQSLCVMWMFYGFIIICGLNTVLGNPTGKLDNRVKPEGGAPSPIRSNSVEYAYARTKKPNKPSKEERKYAKRRGKLAQRWEIDTDGFLEQYGYLRTIPSYYRSAIKKPTLHSRFDRKHAVRLFQEFHGLKATGKLNKKTVKIMKEPRCGLPDVRLDDPYSRLREFHFYKYYWSKLKEVADDKENWMQRKMKSSYVENIRKTIKKAFETWSAVSGVRFLYTRNNPDVEIFFEQGNHGDGRSIAFDEQGGQAAHAFGPGTYTISGNVHLDDDENWTLSVNPKDGINLLAVAIHEIGHSLGLHHSRDPRSVMYPAFVSTNLDLSRDDIENIQMLYGPNPEMSEEAYKKLTPSTTPTPICKITMDDIELGPDEYTYIFKKSRVRQIDPRGKIVRTKDKVNIWDVYKKGPPRVDAVAFLKERKKTYMFYNNTLWRYTNFDLDYGYPKNISGMPETPNAGAFIRDQYGITRLLLFGKHEFWEWSTGRDVVMKGYPLPTKEYFLGLPDHPIGAVRHKDGYIYFFKKDKVYKVHPGSYDVLEGYPKPHPPSWMLDIC